MGTLNTIIAGVVGLLVMACGYFKIRGDQHKADAQRFKQEAESNAATAKVQADATEALDQTAAKQQAAEKPPDTEKRDDLEGQL